MISSFRKLVTSVVSKAYKLRIYPTTKRSTRINKTIGCARFVFNSPETYFGTTKSYIAINGLKNINVDFDHSNHLNELDTIIT
ncbi:hypothetical protein BVG16_27445 [Paenibacillus selenitireducens]|uniref:Transposase putative helix-turn-helix domain-containing protein n=1 Tax=Paenibacillus selenitireducens TaxID=1324314 RepID=A0A1T2X1X0_9BACL|nr:hypothetical protein BVG16_27445 [Paenibacillus selenitireducens]